jgi:hypothetical protein
VTDPAHTIPSLQAELDSLEARVRTVLPEEYQNRYEDMLPKPMGSAPLRFDSANRVAWNEIWNHFCDLALAGGPPHKGKLLESATPGEIAAAPDRYREVVAEICRGLDLVAEIPVFPSPHPGWVRLTCTTPVMAGWLARAISVENVSVHAAGNFLELPAGPHYRLEKEIKNVVTVLAKTFHYFDWHIDAEQQSRIAGLFHDSPLPLLQPIRRAGFPDDDATIQHTRDKVATLLSHTTGLPRATTEYFNWVGLQCPDIRSALWMMRAILVNHSLARREEQCLYLPIHPKLDPTGDRLSSLVSRIQRLAIARGVLHG